MEQRIVVKHSQSGTVIQMEVIIFAIRVAYSQVPNIHVLKINGE
jgi:hypothetical protein